MDLSKYAVLSHTFLPPGILLAGDIHLYFQANQNIVLFRQMGSEISPEDFLKLSQLKSQQILVAKEEHQAFIVSFSQHIAMAAANSTGDPAMSNMVASLMKNLKTTTVPGVSDRTDLRKSLDFSTSIVKDIMSKFQHPSAESFLQLMKGLEKSSNAIDCHHKYVSTLSVLGLFSLGVNDMNELCDLSLAGLVHDTGLTAISKQLLDKHLNGSTEMTNQEKIVYLRHIELGVDLLRSSGTNISDGVIRIIQHHHENWDGSGFKGLVGKQIYRPARMLRIIDDFVSKIDAVTSMMDFERAFSIMDAEDRAGTGQGLYDSEMFTKLKAIMR